MGSNLRNDRIEERQMMVEDQIFKRGISNLELLASMLEVPRHCFVPNDLQLMAYNDNPLPIGDRQTISQPYIVAAMIEALSLKSTDRVLEIGTGSGYAAAVLSRLVAQVFTIERIDHLAERANSVLQQLGYNNIEVSSGDGTMGWKNRSPFDGIMVSAGAPSVPEALTKQLAPGGRLVIPVGDKEVQELLRVTKDQQGELHTEVLALVRFVPLIGKEGWDSLLLH
ncbi:MAG: protein-L-isoaspartate(D-aspartate) O-methyltransferase [Ignavibacteriales bacterium]